MFEYYSVLHRQFLWINCLALNRLQTVEPEVTVMDYGIDAIKYAAMIRNKLEHIRQMV
jgi:hypothetical protein